MLYKYIPQVPLFGMNFMYDQHILDQILSAFQSALQPIQPRYLDAKDSHH